MHETVNNLYIIEEYCEGTTLREFLAKRKRLKQNQVLFCMREICKGYSQLVNRGIIHRDLKPQNILISGQTLKICDFGFAKQITTQNQILTSTVGSPFYMAPQILRQQKYNSKCDVWSFGIIVFELLYGRLPWEGSNTLGLLRKILVEPLKFPDEPKISKQMQNFIQNCLITDEKQRLSWLQIFQHSIFDKQQQFSHIAKSYRSNAQSAKNKLNQLASIVKPYQLVGAFLQFQVRALDYKLFTKIISQYLIPTATLEQLNIMYQMFDKDCNGVIELGQFVKAFQVCNEQIADVLNQMVEQNMGYDQMIDEYIFKNTAKAMNRFEQSIIDEAYAIVMQINYEGQS